MSFIDYRLVNSWYASGLTNRYMYIIQYILLSVIDTVVSTYSTVKYWSAVCYLLSSKVRLLVFPEWLPVLLLLILPLYLPTVASLHCSASRTSAAEPDIMTSTAAVDDPLRSVIIDWTCIICSVANPTLPGGRGSVRGTCLTQGECPGSAKSRAV